jgi:hypothetical protein
VQSERSSSFFVSTRFLDANRYPFRSKTLQKNRPGKAGTIQVRISGETVAA